MPVASPNVSSVQSWLQQLSQDLGAFCPEAEGAPLEHSGEPWCTWLQRFYPHVCTRPFAARHERLWEWFDGLSAGERQRARVEVWGRGGAKSSTAELGVTRVGAKLSRRFVLYVSETQDQADKHVQSISTLFESLNVERMVGKYGHSKGWRRDQLRTAHGFNVAALGLDVAARGIKLDHYRPDLIVFDDIDNQEDSERTVLKKIRGITTSILPTGAPDCAYLFIQNLIHEEGVVARLVDGRADFLHDREPAFVEPAVIGLQYAKVDRGDGANVYRVTGGTPTWDGQDLATCEAQINEWGLEAFLREAQHDVRNASGYVFDVAQLRTVKPAEVPELVSICLAWDLAATEGAGDWTVGVLLGKAKNGVYYVLAVIRGQWASHRVKAAIKLGAAYYRDKKRFPSLRLKLPQDGGQAGKDQADQFRAAYPGAQIDPVTGNKATRAQGFAEQVNLGNVCLVQQDLPEFLIERSAELGGKPLLTSLAWDEWHRPFKECLRKFREDVRDQQDDDVDASSDAFNELAGSPGKFRPAAGAGRGRPA